MPERIPDELLMQRAGTGDQAAFLEIYERYRNPIFRFCYRLLGTVELAEDTTHDCFLNLIRKPENFDPELGSLRTYLYAAARNIALKHFRTLGREESLERAEPKFSVSSQSQPLKRLLESELSTKVREAVVALPPYQREALVLFEYEGLSLKEIAEVVGADLAAVKARLFRARQNLKTVLMPYLNSHKEIATLEKALK